ncbi:MAG: hypothetical protein JEZ07_02785 [Phycisphaerae bacterium]|nr:hypothetical protein [Phycisphaerae bacterium]
MAKLKNNNNDSLELMLDTICNIFGGIILMAILVIIQTQLTAQNIPDNAPDSEIQLANTQSKFVCEQLEKEIFYKEQQKKGILNESELPITKNTMQLFDRQVDFEAALLDSRKKHQQVEKNINSAVEQQLKNQKEIEKLTQELTQYNINLEQNKLRLSKRSKKKVHDGIRLPYQHNQKSAKFCNFIVKGNKIYLITMVKPDENSIAGHCKITTKGNGVIVTPISELGYIINESSMPDEFDETLEDYNSLNLFVSGDNESFQSFQSLKNYIIKKEYRYRINHFDSDKELILYIGRGISNVE